MGAALAGGLSALAGAGISAYGASQAKPGSWKPIRDYRESMVGYLNEFPTVAGMEKYYQPTFAAIGGQTAGETIFGRRRGRHYQPVPFIDEDGQFHWKQVMVDRPPNPGLLNLMERAQGPMEEAYYGAQERRQDRTLGRFSQMDPHTLGLYDDLGLRAREGLELGGRLDPSTRREISQAVLAGQSARGMGLGQSDLYGELMEMGGAAEDRKRRREDYAMGVYQTRPQIGALLHGLLTENPTAGLGMQAVGAGYSLSGATGPKLGIDPFRSPGMHPANNAGANAMAAGGAGLMQLGGTYLANYYGNRNPNTTNLAGYYGGVSPYAQNDAANRLAAAGYP